MTDISKISRIHAARCAQAALDHELAEGRTVNRRSTIAVLVSLEFSENKCMAEDLCRANSAAYGAWEDCAIGKGARFAASAAEEASKVSDKDDAEMREIPHNEMFLSGNQTMLDAINARWNSVFDKNNGLAQDLQVEAANKAKDDLKAEFDLWLLTAVKKRAKHVGVFKEDGDQNV